MCTYVYKICSFIRTYVWGRCVLCVLLARGDSGDLD